MGYGMPAEMWAVLDKHLTTKSVIGEPVTFGEITMIPVMDLMFGYGGGAGEGRDEKQQGGGGGGGGAGARLAPKAVIVIKGGSVEVLPLSKGSAIEKIVEAIPGLVEKFQAKAAKDEEAKAE
ncbi:MAG: GerW family sporulation protein [Bacillota bacterium]